MGALRGQTGAFRDGEDRMIKILFVCHGRSTAQTASCSHSVALCGHIVAKQTADYYRITTND